MSDAPEIWKGVPGFESSYEVSTHGRVRSLDRYIEYDLLNKTTGKIKRVRLFKEGRILRPGPAKSGHLSVSFGHEEGTRQVHELVLTTFVGPRPQGQEALHWNDIPSDNRLENLRWGTRAENIQDAYRNKPERLGERHWKSKLKDEDIPVIRSMFGKYSYMEIARKFGVDDSTIRQIKTGQTWKQVKGVSVENTDL